MIPGPSLNEEKDPVKRMQKLNERRQHIEDEIAILQDRHYLIAFEMSELNGELKG